MLGIAGLSITLLGAVLFFIPLPLPLFVSPALALTGLSLSYARKNPSQGEVQLRRVTLGLAITTVVVTLLYYAALYIGVTALT